MEELTIQYHDFEKAKQELKKFSEQYSDGIELKRVDDNKDLLETIGDFVLGRGLNFTHTVTGEELNELITQLQANFQCLNEKQIGLTKEFGQVYCALEALDRDYIRAIVKSLNSSTTANEDIQKAQEQLSLIIERQKRTIDSSQESLRRINKKITALQKRIKCVYWVMGGMLGLVLLEFALLLRVL